ncbi:phosphoenolpyruvate--protein phosphotransferase [Catenulispora sp. NL8]|uniref:Phosphoenolpyruvate-protein phosphotransferase n=2 Tax=Catenulispora pinistramenti TaxID=2705254 RepID=A0ABS5KTM4_9ACTN|nr:phosphoenolpyruvate--protein phosphotransferase [Catenulispora pinistramenti]MBS2549359.1 phosphoenolpyruvate--protein phosphotransferase [Catenulispora pinistramenti]
MSERVLGGGALGESAALAVAPAGQVGEVGTADEVGQVGEVRAAPGAGPQTAATSVLSGVGVSAGTAIGPVVRMTSPEPLPPPRPVADAAAERSAAERAVAELAADLAARAERLSGEAKEILEALAMIAEDPTLGDDVRRRVAAGTDAPHALTEAFDAQADLLREGGGYLAERAADLEDLRDRAVAAVLGRPIPGIPDPGHPFVLVAADLAPADTANLNPDQVLAIVTERGGPTSHTAILARGLGIPAIVAAAGATGIADGTNVAVDGTSGTVTVGVEPAANSADVPHARATRAARTQVDLADLGPGHTKDGHPVSLYLNIGSMKDVRTGAQGAGLLRTEFLFLGRKDSPSRAEQHAAYLELFNAFPGARVVIRTLDAGADKPLPFLALPDEENPALGVRGLRTARLRPEVLDDQLAAIASAAEAAACEVWVMAPMVATPAEAADFAARARAHGLQHVGAMVEIPAAALRAARLLEHLDFLSIGTNDLGQYTMAADRQDGRLPDLLDPWQPALLELIALAAEAGRAAGKPVGVCGEAAADPRLAAVLVGLGVTSLSMAAAAVPAVHAELSARTLRECRELAEQARDALDPAQARALASRS